MLLMPGFTLCNFKLNTSKHQLQDGPYEVSQLCISRAELQWPSWQDPLLRVRAGGVKLELLQRCMAKVRLGRAAVSLYAALQLYLYAALLRWLV